MEGTAGHKLLRVFVQLMRLAAAAARPAHDGASAEAAARLVVQPSAATGSGGVSCWGEGLGSRRPKLRCICAKRRRRRGRRASSGRGAPCACRTPSSGDARPGLCARQGRTACR